MSHKRWFVGRLERPAQTFFQFSALSVLRISGQKAGDILRKRVRSQGRTAQWAMSSVAVVADQLQQGAKVANAKGRADEARGSVVSISAAEGVYSPNKRSSINLFINQQMQHLRAATEVILHRHALLHVSRASPTVLRSALRKVCASCGCRGVTVRAANV